MSLLQNARNIIITQSGKRQEGEMSGIYRKRGETDAQTRKQKRAFLSIVKSNLEGLGKRGSGTAEVVWQKG